MTPAPQRQKRDEMSEGPNILLVMTDQQRFDSLGCYGLDAASTPALDGLAASGALFRNAYCNSPVCTPSRASILTGAEVPGHGVRRLHDQLDPRIPLFPRLLRGLGYQTGLVGKLHVSGHRYESAGRHPLDGFDRYEWCNEPGVDLGSPLQAYGSWLRKRSPEVYEALKASARSVKHCPPELHMSTWAAERTIDFIENRDRDRPFFAMMSVFDPHNPYYNNPPGTAKRIGELPPIQPGPDDFDGLPHDLVREYRSKRLADHLDDLPLETARTNYHASVSFLDEQLNRVLRLLEAEGIVDRTLVIFTSDHGDMLGDRGLITKGAFFYDPGVRVPLILSWPEQLDPSVVDAPVQLNDIAATVLDAAGAHPGDLARWVPAARSLLPLAAGDKEQAREYVVCAYRNAGRDVGGGKTYFDPPINASMIRDHRHKLNLYLAADSEIDERSELYDMQEDPREENNLWSEPKADATRARLLAALLRWETGHPAPIS